MIREHSSRINIDFCYKCFSLCISFSRRRRVLIVKASTSLLCPSAAARTHGIPRGAIKRAGIPFNRFIGHSSLVMTVHYTVLNQTVVHRGISQAFRWSLNVYMYILLYVYGRGHFLYTTPWHVYTVYYTYT